MRNWFMQLTFMGARQTWRRAEQSTARRVAFANGANFDSAASARAGANF